MSLAPAIPEKAIPKAVSPDVQRFVFRDVSWAQFEAFLNWAGNRRLRVAYDRGALEIRTLSAEHENDKRLIGRLIVALAEELDVPMNDFGSTTWRREDLVRGIEADECFYFQNEHRIRGKTTIDLDRDPSPDLVLEIDITRSSLDRQGICAVLGVPEFWRFDGETLRLFRPGSDGNDVPCPESPTFPSLPVVEFVHRGRGANLTAWINSFRTWVRERVIPGPPRDAGPP